MLENSYIHNKWAQKHIDIIKNTALEIWGNNIIFDEIRGTAAPVPEFNWYAKIYSKYLVNFHYDRGILSIELPVDNVFYGLSLLANESIIIGFDSLKPQNLFHNLKVLDRYLQQKMKEQN